MKCLSVLTNTIKNRENDDDDNNYGGDGGGSGGGVRNMVQLGVVGTVTIL